MIIRNLAEQVNTNIFVDLKEFTGFPGYLKIEGLNLAGSIKLKPALHAINSIRSNLDFNSSSELIESSSGNFGVALAMICAQQKIPFTCVVDPNVSEGKITRMKSYGAKVIRVTERDGNGGYLGSRIEFIRNYIEKNKNAIWINQYENTVNWLSHQKTTALEIFSNFKKIDYLVVGVGTGGTIKGMQEFIKENDIDTKLVAVDTEGSITFGGSPHARKIPGLGSSIGAYHYSADSVEIEYYVSESDAICSCKELARSGLYLGGSSGTIYHAMKKIRNELNDDCVIMGISPDFGDSYTNIVY